MLSDDRKIRIKVFDALCGHCTNIMDGWVPYPCTVITHQLGISLYKTRKAMRELVKEGFAAQKSCILDREESMLPYHGFTVTDKGRKTGIYRYNLKKEARICAECFGYPESEFLRNFGLEDDDGKNH